MNTKFKWRSPSNIALVKYWGKHGVQLPANPSISFTLSRSYTETEIQVLPKTSKWIDFRFEGESKPEFLPKLETFFNRIGEQIPTLKDHSFKIASSNSFPHSSGIASSASAMSALALCLCDWQSQSSGQSDADWKKKASQVARLGSGSAARSVFGGYTLWGKTDHLVSSDDHFASPLDGVHANFLDLQDTILLIDEGVKSVSSTVGHGLMEGHAFSEQRFVQAEQHIGRMLSILRSGDFNALAELMESEALTLHAMMMTSETPYILVKPGTIEVISRIMERRKQGEPITFTLDAGANVHMIYPKSYVDKALDFIESDLLEYCANGSYICDEVGSGPQRMEPNS